jgi:hypothetical protein
MDKIGRPPSRSRLWFFSLFIFNSITNPLPPCHQKCWHGPSYHVGESLSRMYNVSPWHDSTIRLQCHCWLLPCQFWTRTQMVSQTTRPSWCLCIVDSMKMAYWSWDLVCTLPSRHQWEGEVLTGHGGRRGKWIIGGLSLHTVLQLYRECHALNNWNLWRGWLHWWAGPSI